MFLITNLVIVDDALSRLRIRAMGDRVIKRHANEAVIIGLLFIAALGLRWLRLDLMTFQYDHAEAAFRARDTLSYHYPPLTGIINSLGFRNAPGFIWAILPPFLFAADPVIATGWMGALCATAVFPLRWLSRRLCRGPVSWIPAALFATLPITVFAGRSLWAQHLLPAISAWVLWLVMSGSSRRAACGLALCSAGVSVHFSMAAQLMIVTAWLSWRMVRKPRVLAMYTIAIVIPLFSLLPSISDYYRSRGNGGLKRETPDFAAEFEMLLPPPKSVEGRLGDALRGSLNLTSLDAVHGIERQLSATPRLVCGIWDGFTLLLYGTGVVLAGLTIGRAGSRLTRGRTALVLGWLFLPPLAGAILIPRVNAGYFLQAQPALLLCICYLGRVKIIPRVAGRIAVPVLAAGYAGLCAIFLYSINRNGMVDGPYYIPYVQQLKTVKVIAAASVPRDHVIHLSGGWFERPYEYIHQQVLAAPRGDGAFALIEDAHLRRSQPSMLRVFSPRIYQRVGSVGIGYLPDSAAVDEFMDSYYAVSGADQEPDL